MNNLAQNGNLVEAVFWVLVAFGLFAKALPAEVGLRKTLLLLSSAFFIFGVSDLIESQTGAWWRPFWLLILKAACIAAFLYGFRHYYRFMKNKKRSEPSHKLK